MTATFVSLKSASLVLASTTLLAIPAAQAVDATSESEASAEAALDFSFLETAGTFALDAFATVTSGVTEVLGFAESEAQAGAEATSRAGSDAYANGRDAIAIPPVGAEARVEASIEAGGFGLDASASQAVDVVVPEPTLPEAPSMDARGSLTSAIGL